MNLQNLYFISLFLYLITEVTLITLNMSSASKENKNLPKSVKNLQSETNSKEKSIAYTRDKSRLNILTTIYSGILIFIFIKAGYFGLIDEYLRQTISSFYLRACTYIIGISFIFSILQMPFGLYSTFVIEEKYGFNKMTFKLWLKDLAKGLALSLVLAIPLLLALLYFMQTFEKNWWIYGFLALSSFQIILMIIFPVFIAPIFNKFEKLKDQSLADEINSLAEKLKFETKGIFQIDGSKRSAHANAYFAGFGKARRIVLFDTLIEKLSKNEICAVLAHEIGHAKKHHIVKSVILSLTFLFISFYIASLLLSSNSFFHAFGIKIPSAYALLVLISVAFEPIMFFLSPLTSIFSRKNEYEADRYAVDAVGNSSDLELALAKLFTESLSNLNPHPLFSFFHYSHPTLVERINAMKEYELSLKSE